MDLLIIVCAKYLVALPVLVLLAYFFLIGGKQRYRLLWLSVISLPLAYTLARVVGHFVYNPRPFVVGNFTPLIAHAADNGFPSDHTLIAATIAMLVLYFNRKLGLALLVVALLIGVARVLAGVHHSVDIVGAMSIAVLGVALGHYILRYFRHLFVIPARG